MSFVASAQGKPIPPGFAFPSSSRQQIIISKSVFRSLSVRGKGHLLCTSLNFGIWSRITYLQLHRFSNSRVTKRVYMMQPETHWFSYARKFVLLEKGGSPDFLLFDMLKKKLFTWLTFFMLLQINAKVKGRSELEVASVATKAFFLFNFVFSYILEKIHIG